MSERTPEPREPAAANETTPGPASASIAAGGRVVHLPLDAIAADETYMFRARVRVKDLVESIREHGQQLPVIVRRAKAAEATDAEQYQLISGFRRLRALRELGYPTIAAIIRDDLADDAAAFAASVLENTARKTYSDIDRAIVIQQYRAQGHKAADVAAMMGIVDRVRKMIESLLKMPQAVQDAVDDPEHPFSTKHAIYLARLHREFPALDWDEWIARVQAERLSADQMVKAVHKALRSKVREPQFTTLFQGRGTDLNKGEIWFAPTRVVVAAMNEEEKAKLKAELEQVLAALASG